MRITGLTLERYGTHEGRLLALGPGLTLVTGPNEAGKSTLLDAVSDLLWGFPRPVRHAYAASPARLAIAAEIALEDTELEVRRTTRGLFGPEGTAVEAPWGPGGAHARRTWAQSFGLGHQALREGGARLCEGGGELAELVFTARSGRDVRAVLAELDDEADRLYKEHRNASTVELRRAISAYEHVDAAMAEQMSRAGDVAALAEEIERLERRAAGLARDREAADRAGVEAQQRLRAYSAARSVARRRAELAALAASGVVLDAARLAEFDTARSARDAAEAALDELEARLRDLRAERAEIRVEDALTADAERIRVLDGERQTREAESARLADLRAESAARAREAEELVERIEPGVDARVLRRRLEQLTVPADRASDLAALGEEVERAQAAAERAAEAHRQARRTVREAAEGTAGPDSAAVARVVEAHRAVRAAGSAATLRREALREAADASLRATRALTGTALPPPDERHADSDLVSEGAARTAVLPGAVLSDAVLPGAVLSGAVLPGAVLSGAVLPGAVPPTGAVPEPPAAARIAAHRTALRQAAEADGQARREAHRATRRRDAARAALDRLVADGAPADPAALAAARAARDAAVDTLLAAARESTAHPTREIHSPGGERSIPDPSAPRERITAQPAPKIHSPGEEGSIPDPSAPRERITAHPAPEIHSPGAGGSISDRPAPGEWITVPDGSAAPRRTADPASAASPNLEIHSSEDARSLPDPSAPQERITTQPTPKIHGPGAERSISDRPAPEEWITAAHGSATPAPRLPQASAASPSPEIHSSEDARSLPDPSAPHGRITAQSAPEIHGPGADGSTPDRPTPHERITSLAEAAIAVERAVREADRLADGMITAADRMAELTRARAELTATEEELAAAERAAEAAAVARAEARERWTALWADVPAPHPDEADTVRAALLAARTALAERDHALARARDLVADEQAQARTLAAALEAAGRPRPGADLDALLHAAADLEAEADAARDRRTVLARLRADAERAAAEADARRHDLDQVLVRWRHALRAAGEPGDLGPGAWRMRREVLAAAVRAEADARGLAAEAKRLAARVSAHEKAVAALAERHLGAPASPAVALPELTERVREAAAAAVSARHVDALLEQTESEARRVRREAAAARGRLDRLAVELWLTSTPEEGGLDAAAERGREAVRISAEEQTALALLRTAAPDLDADELVAASETAEESGLAADLDQARATAAALSQEAAELYEQLGRLRDRRRVLEGADGAAVLHAEAQEHLARAAEAAERYVVVHLQRETLRRELEGYERRHSSPLLEEAGGLLARLTGGRFTALRPGGTGESRTLVAVRADGEELGPERLSEGTADQVFLALRLAGIRQLQAERRAAGLPVVPVVLDDVLMTFDDARAAAALAVLAELAADWQVLLFSHHDHLAALAGDATVIDLGAPAPLLAS
ncbi:AAA family ATPase [Pseudonocardia oroxyli]|uniref:AAA domain-containing protein n=1 Tax=Pseudonocardia oroxyli TaxID=366584 RepID=A0A1G7I7W0_PSEOR|nr:AAA family ATPase [Pseudonocardia oroxyli]SDF08683.1 AAA domain-containing protein [Pseudonocardia oroxyli]